MRSRVGGSRLAVLHAFILVGFTCERLRSLLPSESLCIISIHSVLRRIVLTCPRTPFLPHTRAQVAFAQVCRTTWDRLSTTPRYAALTALHQHCGVDLRVDKAEDEYALADRIFRPGGADVRKLVIEPALSAGTQDIRLGSRARCCRFFPHFSLLLSLDFRVGGAEEGEKVAGGGGRGRWELVCSRRYHY